MYNVSFVNVNITLICKNILYISKQMLLYVVYTITIHYPYIYAVLKFIPM